jgi:hypothetical protein
MAMANGQLAIKLMVPMVRTLTKVFALVVTTTTRNTNVANQAMLLRPLLLKRPNLMSPHRLIQDR